MLEHEIVIKFGEFEFMKNLLENGEVFMNTLSSYRKQEVGAERHDPNDGIIRMYNMQGVRLLRKDKLSGEELEVAKFTNGTGRVTGKNIDNLNVYCLFCVAIPFDKKVKVRDLIDPVLLEAFGDTAVIISDPLDFLTRVKHKIAEYSEIHVRKKIDYIDMKGYQGEVGPFIKDLTYRHQKELRVAVHRTAPTQPELKFDVGSIEDIACLLPAKELGELYFHSVESIPNV